MGQKKIFSTRIDADRIKALKHLAVDTEKSLGALLEEAIRDICRKYKQKTNAWNLHKIDADFFVILLQQARTSAVPKHHG